MGLLLPDDQYELFIEMAPLILANINSSVFDYVVRQKIQGQNINWYMVEQFPVLSKKYFLQNRSGEKVFGDIVKDCVLELSYTSNDMAEFAFDMGHVDNEGKVMPPFPWDEERRLRLRAKLDAVFFYLYGIMDREDIRYIYSTFPIVEREERAAYGGVYRSCELCLAYLNALKAGHPDAEIAI